MRLVIAMALLLLLPALVPASTTADMPRWIAVPATDLAPATALERIRARGRPLEQGTLNLGFSDRVIWVWYPVHPAVLRDRGAILELDNPLLDHVTVWLDARHMQPDFDTGDMRPFSTRPLPSRNFAFPLQADRVGPEGVLVRIHSTSSLQTRFRLLDHGSWQASEAQERLMAAVLYAVILVLLFYNLLLFVATRDRSFLWFCLYLLSIGLSSATFSGLGLQYLWPEHPLFNNRILPVFLDLSVLFSALFVLSFIPRPVLGEPLYRFWQVLGLGAWFLALASLLLPYTLSIHLFSAIAAVGLSGLVFSGFWAYHRGYFASRFFLLGMLIFLAFGSVRLLVAYDVVPVNLFSNWSAQFGVVLEALLLSLALADRINALKQERAEAQEAAIRNLKRADELKNRFLAVVSHELRTPLNGILGLVGGLLAGARGPVTEAQAETLRLVDASGRRLLGLIDEILDFTTARERGVVLNRAACRLDRLLDQVVQLMQPLFETRGLGLELRLGRTPLPLVSCDTQRIQQVLLNLLGNALKFTDEGRVVISVSVAEDEVCIEVEDTGIGIRDEDIPKVFDPLETAGAHRGGAGLGLAISREIVQAHGGRMELRSSAGHGTRVRFCLPRDEATEAGAPKGIEEPLALSDAPLVRDVLPPAGTSRDTEGSAPRTAGEGEPEDTALPAVWVVDDDPVNLRVATTLLDPRQFRVRTFADGASVLAALFEEGARPDLVLLDLMMPGIDGFEVCARIREHFDALHLPILVVTARVDEESIARAFELGCNDYLVKPFLTRELLARVRAHLSARSLVEQIEENQALRAEIKLRRQTETLLLRAQSILGNLIEYSPEGVVAFDQDGRLLCANTAAQQILGLDEGQQFLDDLSPSLTRILLYSDEELRGQHGELNELIELKDGRSVPAVIRASCYEDGRIYYAVLGHPEVRGEQQSARLQALDAAFNAVGEAMIGRDAGGSVSEPMVCSTEGEGDREQLFKVVIVDAMTASLEAWKQYTHRTKIDLAEDSGLWTVYIDKSTPVTRTLDRYLNLETVPRRPRWRRVLQTVEFVMEHVPADSREHAMLRQLRDRLIELSP
ncbi:MAG TPA: response regulator [Chromatiales bacterium]|nr:response regulator [Chromatiales bacterium]